MTCVLGSDEREALLMFMVAKGGFKALGGNVEPNRWGRVPGRYGNFKLPLVN